MLIYDLNENEEPGAVAVLDQMMAVTALVAIITNCIANVGVMTRR